MNYPYTKTINPDKLTVEILAAALPLVSISALGTSVNILMSRSLEWNEEAALADLVTNHTTTDMATYIKGVILRAASFGQGVMAEYGASNVLAGLTLAQIQSIMAKTSKVQAALQSGSLYVALAEIALIERDEVMTEERITVFRNKIQDYLGIPRT